MVKDVLHSEQDNLVWETLQKALTFRKGTLYVVQHAGEKVDITSNLQALSAFCESRHYMTNLFYHLSGATIESFTPLTFRTQTGRAVAFAANDTVKLFESNLLRRTLTTKDPDTIGRTLSFLRGY